MCSTVCDLCFVMRVPGSCLLGLGHIAEMFWNWNVLIGQGHVAPPVSKHFFPCLHQMNTRSNWVELLTIGCTYAIFYWIDSRHTLFLSPSGYLSDRACLSGSLHCSARALRQSHSPGKVLERPQEHLHLCHHFGRCNSNNGIIFRCRNKAQGNSNIPQTSYFLSVLFFSPVLVYSSLESAYYPHVL